MFNVLWGHRDLDFWSSTLPKSNQLICECAWTFLLMFVKTYVVNAQGKKKVFSQGHSNVGTGYQTFWEMIAKVVCRWEQSTEGPCCSRCSKYLQCFVSNLVLVLHPLIIFKVRVISVTPQCQQQHLRPVSQTKEVSPTLEACLKWEKKGLTLLWEENA